MCLNQASSHICLVFNPDVEVTRLCPDLPNLPFVYPIALCMKYRSSDGSDVRAHILYIGTSSCLWLLLEAGTGARKELSPLQIHSLGMVVIPPIHSNLIWQKLLCMTEAFSSDWGRK